MKTGTVVAIVAGVLVVGGGATAAVLMMRKRREGTAATAKQAAQDLAIANATLGAKAVSQGITTPPTGPGGKPFSASSPGADFVFGTAGKVLDKWYPGLGSGAASIAKTIDSKVGLGLIAKVPGLKKLKFW